jgi:hypothetical protein
VAAISAKSPAVCASLAQFFMGLVLVSVLISGRISIGVFLAPELPPSKVAIIGCNRRNPSGIFNLLFIKF